MGTVTPRPLSEEERAVVSRLCAINELPIPSGEELSTLRVVGGCDCWVPAWTFGQPFAGQIVGEGYGVILWGHEDDLAALKIYML